VPFPAPILDWVRAHACGAPGDCQFESGGITATSPRPDGGSRLSLSYRFDQDGFSQYDKTVSFEGFVDIDSAGQPIGGELRETHRGEAAT
jgi:hypothetical protein